MASCQTTNETFNIDGLQCRLHFTIVIVIAPTIVDRSIGISTDWGAPSIAYDVSRERSHSVQIATLGQGPRQHHFDLCHVLYFSTYYLLFSLCIIQQHPHPNDHNILSISTNQTSLSQLKTKSNIRFLPPHHHLPHLVCQ